MENQRQCDASLTPVLKLSQNLIVLMEQREWETLELEQQKFADTLMSLPIIDLAQESEANLHCLKTIFRNNDHLLEESLKRKSELASQIIGSKKGKKVVSAYAGNSRFRPRLAR